MRRLNPAAVALLLSLTAVTVVGGCRRHAVVYASKYARFLHDRATRRAALEASLVEGAGQYVANRRAHYATSDAASWERLPVWNPPVASIVDRDGAIVVEEAETPLTITAAAAAGDEEALRALGRRAFDRYPAQQAPFDPTQVAEADRARLGLWRDDKARLGGLVRVRFPDGSTGTSMSCATCHATPKADASAHPDDTIAWGASNDALDLGRLMIDAAGPRRAMRDGSVDAARIAPFEAWGPGRIDVSTAKGTEPAHLPDVRATRFELHLQHSGAVVQRDVTSLAVRIETLILTAHNSVVRPPREVSLGLALYLWSLADALPTPRPDAPENARGAEIFARRCARCHAGVGMSGGLVQASDIGTDATLAHSKDRGTGAYRTPSLRGVGSRALLFHDASIAGLDALLDPSRKSADGSRPGHRFGLDLGQDDRAALLTWLRSL